MIRSLPSISLNLKMPLHVVVTGCSEDVQKYEGRVKERNKPIIGPYKNGTYPPRERKTKNPPQSTNKHRTLGEAVADAIAEVGNGDDGHEFSEA
jgi:hypothetical protein